MKSIAIILNQTLSSYVLLEVALIALAGYLLLSIHAFLLVRVLGEMKLSYAYAGPTELRLILIVLTLAMIAAGSEPALFGKFTWFDLVVGTIGGMLILFFVIQTVRTARRLAIDEPAPRQ